MQYMGGRPLTKSERDEIRKRNLGNQTTRLEVYAGSGKWEIWPINPDLAPENIVDFLKGTKVFQPKEVWGLTYNNSLLVFNFDTGVGVEVTFQG